MSDETKKIIDHIIDLYGISGNDAEKMNNNISEYEKAFEGYSCKDVIKAVSEYWRWKSDKTRPSLSKILAMLESDKDVEKDDFKPKSSTDKKSIDPSSAWMDRDIKLGKCKHLKRIYDLATKRILKDLVYNLVGHEEYKKLSDFGKYQIALRNNLFTDDILEEISTQRGDEVFQSVNELPKTNEKFAYNGKLLAAHFSAKENQNLVGNDNDYFDLAQ
ncbi:MAG: hypothetical protein ACK5N8_06730 [Alphaproteobacteria bacterium]